MSTGPVDDDPGWGRPRDFVLATILPAVGIRRAGQANKHGLVVLRSTVVGFVVMATIVVGVALILAAGDEPASLSTAAACLLVGVGGTVSLGLSLWAGGELRCDDASTLASSYRARFFRRSAFANLPTLLGFVAMRMSGSLWPTAIGFVLTLIGLTALAPTRSRLRREQDALSARACPHDLVRALGDVAAST